MQYLNIQKKITDSPKQQAVFTGNLYVSFQVVKFLFLNRLYIYMVLSEKYSGRAFRNKYLAKSLSTAIQTTLFPSQFHFFYLFPGICIAYISNYNIYICNIYKQIQYICSSSSSLLNQYIYTLLHILFFFTTCLRDHSKHIPSVFVVLLLFMAAQWSSVQQ